MKLYYTRGACSLTVRIIINELGLKCNFDKVDLKNKKTESGEDFLKINIKGAVPTLVLDNGEVLTENAVILQYLANSNNATNHLPKVNDFKRYHTLEWLNYVATELHKTISALYNPKLTEDIKNAYQSQIKNKFNYINNHLSEHNYLLGESFTLPDAYLFVMITWLIYFKFNLAEWPHVKQYFDKLKNRESIKKSLIDENLQYE